MTTIYKYKLPTEEAPGNYKLELPCGAKALSVGIQNGETFMWALIDPAETLLEKRDVAIAFTGEHSTPELRKIGGQHRFLGTLQIRGDVLHYFIEERTYDD